MAAEGPGHQSGKSGISAVPGESPGNLILAARGLGRNEEAAEAQRGLDELKASDPQYAPLDARLAAVLKGEAAKDNAERLALAQRAYDTKRYVAAAKLWAEALKTDPKLAADRQAGHRYNAACAAALAASARGRTNGPPTIPPGPSFASKPSIGSRPSWPCGRSFSNSARPQAKAFIVQILKHWQEDTDLAGVRGDKVIEAVPEAERAAWRARLGRRVGPSGKSRAAAEAEK